MASKKGILSFFLVFLMLIPAAAGCSSGASQDLNFPRLISEANKYNGKTVTLESFYFSGFEISVIAESVGPSASGFWGIVPQGTLVWVEKGLPQEMFNKLYTQTVTPSGYPERMGRVQVTGKFETGGRYGHLNSYLYQINITEAELLEWSPPPATRTGQENSTITPAETPLVLDEAQTAGRQTAEDCIRNSSTFRFDGIDGSIRLIKNDPGPTSAFRSWSYTFEFQTRQSGHGDRTGQFLAQIITTHEAAIMVNLEKGTIIAAVCDNTWDMINEKELPVTVRGIVISGGDTSQPGGPLDTPRKFVYQVLTEEGMLINVSYIGYPPSPVGDAMREKIVLDFYQGEIRVGDKMEARGTLDGQTNTVVVAEAGDYISTSLKKATVVGVVVDIKDITPEGETGQYIYELLREDGTFINVSLTAGKGVALSLYNETIQVGNFMKAVGTYNKGTNTVLTAGQDDMIKTYDHSPVSINPIRE